MRLPSYTLGVVLAFLLQVGLLGWIVVDRAMLLEKGKEIRLTVVPTDPHDIFRGDYVLLNYDISSLNNMQLAGDDAFNPQDTIYVSLAGEPGALKATAISRTPPTGGGLFLKGTVRDLTDLYACSGIPGCWIYTVEYNLEQFFVPEGTGKDLETLRDDERVAVDVAVAEDGRAALKRLLVDGVARYQEPPY